MLVSQIMKRALETCTAAREAERELAGTQSDITPKELTDTLEMICQPRAVYPVVWH